MRLEVQRLRGIDASDFGALGTGLLAWMKEAPDRKPRLVIAELSGEGVLLGRHQRRASALRGETPAFRRAGGGRSAAVGEGCLGVLLGLPDPGALLEGPVGPDRLINRYVRGLLAGLTARGAGRGAHYFGRDFVSSESRQLALVSQDGAAKGACLFESLVGWRRPVTLPPELNAYPAHEDPRAAGPEPTSLEALAGHAHDFDSVVDSIADGYGRMYRCELVAVEEPALLGAPPEPAVDEDETGFERSGVADIPIGFAEALLKHDGGRVIEARFRGDFIAPAFAVRSLEESLRLCPLEFSEIGRRVDEAFRQPGAAVLGLRSLRVFADAILAAAGRL